MKWTLLRFWLPRFVAAFLLAILITFLHSRLSLHRDNSVQKSYANQIILVFNSLRITESQITSLPSDSLSPGIRGSVVDRANIYNQAAKQVTITMPPQPPPNYKNPQTQEQKDFNEAVLNKDYSGALDTAVLTLAKDKAYFSHRAAVLKALANLLQYQPDIDMSTNDRAQIKDNLTAASDGLTKTIARLGSVPYYRGDQTLNNVTLMVRDAKNAVDNLKKQINSSNFESDKTNYIVTIQRIQAEIIKNRNNFRDGENRRLLATTSNAYQKLEPFVAVFKRAS